MSDSFQLQENAQVPGTPYRLMTKLGEGAFGEVWKARHPTRPLLYALKFCKDRDVLRTFRNEAKHLDRLMRVGLPEGFVRLHEIYDEDDREMPFVAYEFAEGEDFAKFLRKRLAEEGPFSPFEAAEVVLALASIMARIHTLNDPIVHRDLKPSNVLVLNDGPPWRFKVVDFGLGVLAVTSSRAAELTISDEGRELRWKGTANYMAYEQCHSDHVGHPSDDVHALGMIWYELLMGETHAFGRSPPSHSRHFDWLRLKQELLGVGLVDKEAALLMSCLQRHESRPNDALVLVKKLRTIYPPLRDSILSDVAEIERSRMTGEDWLALVCKLVEKKRAAWDEGVRHNVPEACWLVGLHNQHGIGTDTDLGKARALFQRAADKGCPDARCDLGLLLMNDQRERALDLLKQAAEQDHAEAAFRLGEILSRNRAIDVLPFIHSGDPTAVGASRLVFEMVDGQSVISTVDVGEPMSLAEMLTPRDPQSPKREKNNFYTIAISPERVWWVTGTTPNKVPPIRLFLPHPVSHLLDLPPRVRELLEALGLETLKDVLSWSEGQFCYHRAEYAFGEIRTGLEAVWCDPWATCQHLADNYLKQAATLGNTRSPLVQPWPPSSRDRHLGRELGLQ